MFRVNYCANCGNEIEGTMKFCPNCGNKLTVSQEQPQARPYSGEELKEEELERITKKFIFDKWGGEVIAIHSVSSGKRHRINGSAMIPYIEKKGGQLSSSDSVFYGGYAEYTFRLQIRFDGEVVGYKREQISYSEPDSTIEAITLDPIECESRECYFYPSSGTPKDLLDKLTDRRLKDTEAKCWKENAETEKHRRGNSLDSIRKKFGL